VLWEQEYRFINDTLSGGLECPPPLHPMVHGVCEGRGGHLGAGWQGEGRRRLPGAAAVEDEVEGDPRVQRVEEVRDANPHLGGGAGAWLDTPREGVRPPKGEGLWARARGVLVQGRGRVTILRPSRRSSALHLDLHRICPQASAWTVLRNVDLGIGGRGAGKGCGKGAGRLPPNQLLGWSPPPLKGGLGFQRDPRASGCLAASEGRGRSAASVGVSERIRMLRASTAPTAVECRRRCLRESEASGG